VYLGYRDLTTYSTMCNKIWTLSKSRNGIVRHESVMKLRNKLEELGKMKGVNQDEKGISVNC